MHCEKFNPLDWALLIDGTALFFGQRSVSPEKTMNYHALSEILTETSSVTNFPPKRAYFFTATDESNEKQIKFNELIRGIGWKVVQTPAQLATVSNPLLGDADNRLIRFDASIAYTLARLTSAGMSRIVLVTDSYPLATPVRDCVRRRVRVTIAFFGSLIDSRWYQVVREDSKRTDTAIDFLDLDAKMSQLFDRPRSFKRRDDEWLSDLP